MALLACASIYATSTVHKYDTVCGSKSIPFHACHSNQSNRRQKVVATLSEFWFESKCIYLFSQFESNKNNCGHCNLFYRAIQKISMEDILSRSWKPLEHCCIWSRFFIWLFKNANPMAWTKKWKSPQAKNHTHKNNNKEQTKERQTKIILWSLIWRK